MLAEQNFEQKTLFFQVLLAVRMGDGQNTDPQSMDYPNGSDTPNGLINNCWTQNTEQKSKV